MASDGTESVRIYAIIKDFTHPEWKEFAKTHIGLSPSDIEDIEYEHHRDLKEQKYQMWLKWKRRNGRDATVEAFQSLVNAYRSVGVMTQSQYAITTPVDDIPSPLDFNSNTHSTRASTHAQTTVKTVTTPTDQNLTVINSMDHQAVNTASSGQSAKAFVGDMQSCKQKKKVTSAVHAPSQSGEGATTFPKKPQATELNDLHGAEEAVVDGKSTNPFKRILSSFRKKRKDTKRNGSSEGGTFCNRVTKVSVEGATLEKFKEHASKSDDIYPITGNPKGCVLILNNTFEDKQGGHKPRHGSDMDVKNMKKLWKGLGCVLHKKEPQCEKTAEEMKALIREMTMVKKRYGFLVIVIMTHGGIESHTKDQVFIGADGEKVKVKEVIEWFHNTNSKHLHDIPKLFIFQFCRGEEVDPGVATDSKGFSMSGGYHDAFEFEMKEIMENIPSDGVVTDGCASIVPSITDILIAYATHENHAALRDEKDGSWFINAITNVFMRYAKDDHVADLFTRVHASMKAKTGVIVKRDKYGREIGRDGCKAMSNHQTSFSKKLYLFPGHPA